MIRHIAFTLASRVSSILALLLCTPFYFRVLGVDGYALIATSLIAHSLSGLIDAGLSPLAAAALARAGDERRGRGAVLSEVFLRSGRRIIPLWIISVTGMTLYYILAAHETSTSYAGSLTTSMILFSDVFALVFFRIQYACLQGAGRHAVANILYTITLGLRAALGVAAVLMFRVPQAVLAAQAVGALVGIGAALLILEYDPLHAWRIVSRPWRGALSDQSSINAVALRNLWAISFFASVTSVFPQLVVKFAGAPADLSRFSLAGSVANALLAFQTAYQAVLLPEFAQRTRAKDEVDPPAAAGRAMTGTFVIVSICGASYVSAESLLALWLGDFDAERLHAIATLMRWQLASVALLAATAVPYVLCIVQGRTKPQLQASLVYFILTALGTPLGYRLAGTRGVAIAATLATALFSIVYVLAAEKASFSMRAFRLIRWAILPGLAGALPAFVTLLLVSSAPPKNYTGAFANLVLQTAVALAFTAGVAAMAYRFHSQLFGRKNLS